MIVWSCVVTGRKNMPLYFYCNCFVSCDIAHQDAWCMIMHHAWLTKIIFWVTVSWNVYNMVQSLWQKIPWMAQNANFALISSIYVINSYSCHCTITVEVKWDSYAEIAKHSLKFMHCHWLAHFYNRLSLNFALSFKRFYAVRLTALILILISCRACQILSSLL